MLRAGTKLFDTFITPYIYFKVMKSDHSWRTTFTFATIIVVIAYGSFKAWEVGAFSP